MLPYTVCFLTFRPHLERKENCWVHTWLISVITELDNVWLSNLKPVINTLNFQIFITTCIKITGNKVLQENSTFGINFSATYYTDHIRFFSKSQRAKSKIKETDEKEYRSWKWWQKKVQIWLQNNGFKQC